MTTLDDMFPSKYLKASDFEEDRVMTISHIDQEEMKDKDGNEETKPVLYLQGEKKGIVLNRTNAKTIAKLYGPTVEDWIGKRITLCSMEVDAFGEMKDAIRIRSKAPVSKADPSAPAGNGSAPKPSEDMWARWRVLWNQAAELGIQFEPAAGTISAAELGDKGRALRALIDAALAKKADETF